MRSFFKFFLACLLALFIFCLVLIVSGVGFISSAASDDKPQVKDETVLLLDVSRPIMDQTMEAGFEFPAGLSQPVSGVYDLAVALRDAGDDKKVKGLMITGNYSPNGFATNDELRQAIIAFKRSGKFVVASSSYFNQRSYELASTADSIFVNPAGGLDWQGYAYQLLFFKETLDRLNVKPEIFYAGKFKSATEPFRRTEMSQENRLQLGNFLGDLYSAFLLQSAKARNTDTATLQMLASTLAIGTANDAKRAGLIDVVGYDDEVRALINRRLSKKPDAAITFMPLAHYAEAEHGRKVETSEKVALVFAQGEIIDGRESDNAISGENMRNLLRKLRNDKRVKAVVLRVNSPGGSPIASEVIHREVELLKKDKPVVVSMGDYAASGGYYIACGADSIFAQQSTLTGSIGVFAILFDASRFLQTKLGITVDEVATSNSATLGSPFRPLNDRERVFLQSGIDSTYQMFLRRVAAGRGMSTAAVDSVGQGRIWSGSDAVALGLADRIGGMHEAVACAARMAKLDKYQVRQYPEQQSIFQKLFSGDKETDDLARTESILSSKLGEEFITLWNYLRTFKNMNGKVQMRLPFFVN